MFTILRLRIFFMRVLISILFLIIVPTLATAQTSFDASGPNGGSIIVGTDTRACDGSIAGAMRYNSSESCVEFCSGSEWVCPRVCDSPNEPLWVTASGTIDVVNENIGVYAQLDATDEVGSPNFQKVSGASWLSVSSTGVVTGKAIGGTGSFPITVRATDCQGNIADRSFDVEVSAWSGPAGCTNPGDLCPDGTYYLGLTPDGEVDFFLTQARAGGFPFNDGSNDLLNPPIQGCSPDNGLEDDCRTGESNTNELVAMDSASTAGFQNHNAALACYCLGETHANAPDGSVPPECSSNPVGTNSLEGHGYDDWYLPAIAELDTIFVNTVSPEDTDNPAWQDGVTSSGGGASVPNTGPLSGLFSSNNIQSSSDSQPGNQFDVWGLNFGTGSYLFSGISRRAGRHTWCVRK
jgi:hypothetical protein